MIYRVERGKKNQNSPPMYKPLATQSEFSTGPDLTHGTRAHSWSLLSRTFCTVLSQFCTWGQELVNLKVSTHLIHHSEYLLKCSLGLPLANCTNSYNILEVGPGGTNFTLSRDLNTYVFYYRCICSTCRPRGISPSGVYGQQFSI